MAVKADPEIPTKKELVEYFSLDKKRLTLNSE